MKRTLKKKSGVYAFLHQSGVLEHGTGDDIANAKKRYWKIYKAQWRQKQRQSMKQFMIALTSSQAKQVAQAARLHNCSASRFIRDACFAYMAKRYLPVDAFALATIRQLLMMNYDALQKMFDDGLPFEIGKRVLQQMTELEQKVLHELYHPKEIVST